jgi:hypothetical protein
MVDFIGKSLTQRRKGRKAKKIKEDFADLAALRENFRFCNELALCFEKENVWT